MKEGCRVFRVDVKPRIPPPWQAAPFLCRRLLDGFPTAPTFEVLERGVDGVLRLLPSGSAVSVLCVRLVAVKFRSRAAEARGAADGGKRGLHLGAGDAGDTRVAGGTGDAARGSGTDQVGSASLGGGSFGGPYPPGGLAAAATAAATAAEEVRQLAALMGRCLLVVDFEVWQQAAEEVAEALRQAGGDVSPAAAAALHDVVVTGDDYTRKQQLARWYQRVIRQATGYLETHCP